MERGKRNLQKWICVIAQPVRAAYRKERDADEENQAQQQKAAIIQRAMEARQARDARLKGDSA